MTVKTANNTFNSKRILTIGEAVYDLAQHTPMMVQYLNMKVRYPQALLLYRMGDFYELFFEDAKLAAQLLDITLTRRGTDKAGNTIAMAGVPFHAADSYMARLIAAGQTVVVCEQIDESATSNAPIMADKQKKDKTTTPANGIMRREVVRTLTAGTITDDALIAHGSTPTVVALDIDIPKSNSKSPTKAAISQLDLAAGTLTTQTFIDVPKVTDTLNNLDSLKMQMLTVLTRFAPSECIVSEALDEQWLLWLRQHLDCPIIEVAATDFNQNHAAATLCQQFAVQRLEGLGIQDLPLAQSSCAALIHYARQTQQRQIPQVNQLIVEHSDDYLIIDAGSQQNLELFTPVSPQGTALISVLNHCKTPMGRRLLVQQMQRPLRQAIRINRRLDAISTLLADHFLEGHSLDSRSLNRSSSNTESLIDKLRLTLATIGDIERISSRIGLMSAKPRDLCKLADGISAGAQLAQLLSASNIDKEQTGLLSRIIKRLPDNLPAVREVAELIDRAIIEEPPAHIRDGGMLATGYDSDFDRLTHLHDNIQGTLDEMAEQARLAHRLPSLKVGFNKVSGFYFELPKAQAQNAPAHFIRRQTLKNAERFITEELKELETDYLSAQTLALAREKQLYNELLTILSSHLSELQQLSSAIAQLDVLCNWAQLAVTYQWQRPVMHTDTSESAASDNVVSNKRQPSSQNREQALPNPASHPPRLDIRGGRHVVVEAALDHKIGRKLTTTHSHSDSTAFVANDCQLGSSEHPERLLLITGPNMGGKSTYMRQTALIVLLAHCGSFVPASQAYIGDIDRIFTRIGSADDLAGGKSTFMVEMIETANILNQATDKSLVLMDEVGRGTATTDGLAIAQACVNKLLDIDCLTLFATHYFELTELDQQHKGIRNVHVAASDVDGQLLLLHKIKQGAASSSFGLHVAKMAGIPSSVLEDAKRYLIDNLTLTKSAIDPTSLDEPLAPKTYKSSNDKNELAHSVRDNGRQRYESSEVTRPIKTSQNEQKSEDSVENKQTKQWLKLQKQFDSIHPDSLTPKQAHDILYELKQLISR